MPMQNYRVEQVDGTVTFYQFEDDDPGLEALRKSAKSRDSEVKSIKAADPPATSSPELQEAAAA